MPRGASQAAPAGAAPRGIFRGRSRTRAFGFMRAGGYSERGVARRGALRPVPSNRTASVAPAPAPSLPRNCPADAADADKISRAARGTAKRSACRGCYGYGLILKVR